MPAALLVHGYTSTPASMRPVADGLVDAGFEVRSPLLPGHGTTSADLARFRWRDWVGAASAALRGMAAAHGEVVVVGQSMGGTIAAWLAASGRPPVAGLAVLNPFVDPPVESFRDLMRGFLAAGATTVPGPANDASDPGALDEGAYYDWPIEPLLSLFEAQDELLTRLAEVACPVLVVTSRQDHVVPPVSSDVLAAAVAGPVERLVLERSYHLATLDCERDLVVAAVVDFARRVAGRGGAARPGDDALRRTMGG